MDEGVDVRQGPAATGKGTRNSGTVELIFEQMGWPVWSGLWKRVAGATESALKVLGTDGLFLFSSLDTDQDMYISPEEFKPIAEKLTGSVPVATYEEEELRHDPSEETLTIEARFQPLLTETMTKSKDGFLGVSRLALSGLRNWTTAASPTAVFAARHFRPFLPPPGQELGQPWWIIPGELSVFTGYLSNNRFYPPPPKDKEGTVACLTAISDSYYTVMFRSLAISSCPKMLHIRDFRLFVPNHRVDLPEGFSGPLSETPFPTDFCPDGAGGQGSPVPSVVLDEDGSGRTLRETVLESPPILTLLNESFISTWSLVKELEDLQTQQENPLHRQLAGLHLEKYSFPVEMMICLPNGTVVHHINANYFLDITSMNPEDLESNVFSFSSTFEDPSTATYMQFLREGLRRGLPLLQP
ncbi:hypothetical protein STEG23_007199 [Scotinomys teguina]